jgi:hypothetical protein
MIDRKQVCCVYDGYARELCPIVLGHTKGKESALTFQFAGESTRKLPSGGDWRCLDLDKVRKARLRSGRWHSGTTHNRPQGCVEDVDLDVNPASPYRPRRKIGSLRTGSASRGRQPRERRKPDPT